MPISSSHSLEIVKKKNLIPACSIPMSGSLKRAACFLPLFFFMLALTNRREGGIGLDVTINPARAQASAVRIR